MKFEEAMIALKSGKKVKKKSDLTYFIMNEGEFETYTPSLNHFIYDASIILSDGWMVEDESMEFSFYEIIKYLKSGKKAWIKDWNEKFIYYKKGEGLIVFQMIKHHYSPDFETILGEDWEIMQ